MARKSTARRTAGGPCLWSTATAASPPAPLTPRPRRRHPLAPPGPSTRRPPPPRSPTRPPETSSTLHCPLRGRSTGDATPCTPRHPPLGTTAGRCSAQGSRVRGRGYMGAWWVRMHVNGRSSPPPAAECSPRSSSPAADTFAVGERGGRSCALSCYTAGGEYCTPGFADCPCTVSAPCSSGGGRAGYCVVCPDPVSAPQTVSAPPGFPTRNVTRPLGAPGWALPDFGFESEGFLLRNYDTVYPMPMWQVGGSSVWKFHGDALSGSVGWSGVMLDGWLAGSPGDVPAAAAKVRERGGTAQLASERAARLSFGSKAPDTGSPPALRCSGVAPRTELPGNPRCATQPPFTYRANRPPSSAASPTSARPCSASLRMSSSPSPSACARAVCARMT